MILKEFQIEKVEELFSFTKDNYELINKTAYLKAPTGSGKTIILGNYIKKVISSEENQRNSYNIIIPVSAANPKLNSMIYFGNCTKVEDCPRTNPNFLFKILNFSPYRI